MYLISYCNQGCTMFLYRTFDIKEEAFKFKKGLEEIYPEYEWHIYII